METDGSLHVCNSTILPDVEETHTKHSQQHGQAWSFRGLTCRVAIAVKLRRLVEAVFMSYSVYGGWKPRAVVTPRHFQKNVHMALNTFEELCKVSKLTDLKTLPPARVWKIFMTVSGVRRFMQRRTLISPSCPHNAR